MGSFTSLQFRLEGHWTVRSNSMKTLTFFFPSGNTFREHPSYKDIQGGFTSDSVTRPLNIECENYPMKTKLTFTLPS